MASIHTAAAFTMFLPLLLQTWSASTDNFFSPIVSPIFDKGCKGIDCGKGRCKASEDSNFGFVCECDPGWKKTPLGLDDGLKLLPCLFSDCTLNYSCVEGPSPAQEKDTLCKEVECGKGTCKASDDSDLGFVCECDPGWKQAHLQHNAAHNFLPCVIPNCTLDFSCQEAPSPAQERAKQANTSIFDPCHWAGCGGGMCNKTSAFTRRCECDEGYVNILNSTAFPCFRDCAIGMNCADLGVFVLNKSSSATPALNLPENSDKKGAGSISRTDFNWLIILAISFAMFSWS